MPAYIISNERQRWATQVVPNVKSVLTVAGSGDQALFYKLAGAENIDTFDININASIIQDIKCAAIKNLSRDEYIDLLTRLYRADSNRIITTPQICRLWEFFSPETQETLLNNRSGMMFGAGHDIFAYPENIPTDDEYKKLGKLLDKKFNFIWSDLERLGIKLQRKYDLINISNIFDYIPDGKIQTKILNDLSEHISVGGHIVYLPQKTKFDYTKFQSEKLSYAKTIPDNRYATMILFQRTR
jgi:hypothetical protein